MLSSSAGTLPALADQHHGCTDSQIANVRADLLHGDIDRTRNVARSIFSRRTDVDQLGRATCLHICKFGGGDCLPLLLSLHLRRVVRLGRGFARKHTFWDCHLKVYRLPEVWNPSLHGNGTPQETSGAPATAGMISKGGDVTSIGLNRYAVGAQTVRNDRILALLKESLATGEGFDPSGPEMLAPLRSPPS